MASENFDYNGRIFDLSLHQGLCCCHVLLMYAVGAGALYADTAYVLDHVLLL